MLAQLSGIWYGELENDSTHRKQSFEIGLSEYRGKITGFTYTTFISNDTFYFSVKRIKAERRDSVLVVVDDEMLYNNFPDRVAKGVKQTTVFPLINDSTIDINNGKWSTNRTKRYYPLYGTAVVKEVENKNESELVSHLQEIKVKNDLAVRKTNKQEQPVIVKNTNPGQKQPPKQNQVSEEKKEPKPSTSVVMNEPATQEIKQPEKKLPDSEISKPIVTSNASDNKNLNTQTNNSTSVNNKPLPVEQKPSTSTQQPNNSTSNVAAVNFSSSNTQKQQPIQKPTGQQSNNAGAVNNGAVANKQMPVVQKTNTNSAPQNTVAKIPVNNQSPVIQAKSETPTSAGTVTPNKTKPDPVVSRELPQDVSVRKSETIQSLYFHGDSLVLSLYDNGVVDGDTVSVFMNGNPVISKQLLKVTAAKKTIYITPDMDSVQLVLFADNLGSIPPNTGLLTVRDGDQVYNVRFSADLQRNAAIVLRRKK